MANADECRLGNDALPVDISGSYRPGASSAYRPRQRPSGTPLSKADEFPESGQLRQCSWRTWKARRCVRAPSPAGRAISSLASARRGEPLPLPEVADRVSLEPAWQGEPTRASHRLVPDDLDPYRSGPAPAIRSGCQRSSRTGCRQAASTMTVSMRSRFPRKPERLAITGGSSPIREAGAANRR